MVRLSDVNVADSTPITVAVRVRPPTQAESLACVRVEGTTAVAVGHERTFAFDHVIADSSPLGDVVFGRIGLPMVQSFLDGFNATIIAYGQTGAGKTHTMNQLHAHIAQRLAAAFDSPENEVTLSSVEVYNDQLFDLLDDTTGGRKLNVREDHSGSVFVEGKTVVLVRSVEELRELLETATTSRRTAPTCLNVSSSRSHCIVAITLVRRPSSNGGDHVRQVVTSALTLVDLAGSERILKAHVSTRDLWTASHRVREGISINSGLLALGGVIEALADKRSHVPFRSSKLTRILQPFLAGNSRTTFVACVASDVSFMYETLNTLKYADRAKQLRLCATRNVLSSSGALTAEAGPTPDNVAEELQSLQSEVTVLRRILAEHGIEPPASANCLLHEKDLHTKIISLEEELLKERRFSRTLEEDLYRAEFALMEECERRKAAPQTSHDEDWAEGAGGGSNQTTTSASAAELEAKEHAIQELRRECSEKEHAVQDYQQRLRRVLDDKARLVEELRNAESRLETTELEQSQRAAHRQRLQATFAAKIKATEIAAAEYRRRVKELDGEHATRQGLAQRIAELERELEGLKRSNKSNCGTTVEKAAVLRDAPQRKLLRRVEPNRPTPSPLAVEKRTAASAHTPSVAVRTTLLEGLRTLDAEIAQLRRERDVLRNAIEVTRGVDSSDSKWHRAVQGFHLRLSEINVQLGQEGVTQAIREELLSQRSAVEAKLAQLEDLRPACDVAVDELRIVEDRIDSLLLSRRYQLRQLRVCTADNSASQLDTRVDFL